MAKLRQKERGGRLIAVSIAVITVAAFGLLSILTNNFSFGEEPWQRGFSWIFQVILAGGAVSLVAALAFDLIYVRPDRERNERAARRFINRELRKNTSEVLSIVNNLQPNYFPSQIFIGTSEPEDEFNRSIMRDMVNSDSYYFQGTGGLWTALRLHYSKRRPRSVRVVLPNLDAASRQYQDMIQYELNIPRNRNANRTPDDVREKIGDDIGAAVMGFFLCKDRIPVTIHFSNRDMESRLEIFDDAAYVCALDRQDPNRARFPETVRFEKGSFNFKFLKLLSEMPNPDKTLTINSDTSENSIADLFLEMGLVQASDRSLDRYVQKFKDFEKAKRAIIDPDLETAKVAK